MSHRVPKLPDMSRSAVPADTVTADTVTADAARAFSHLIPVLALARTACAELSVPDLADHAGYSPFHFTRMVKRATGFGPGQLLLAYRIDAAKRLLLADDDAVVDVAVASGFDSLSSFTRRFKQVVGVTPGRFRRLVDAVADAPPRPFALGQGDGPTVRVRLNHRPGSAVWLGWYPLPAPFGLPRAGVLVRDQPVVDLTVHPEAPHLLAFEVPAGADPHMQLIPREPCVAVHPAPIRGGTEVTLDLRPQPHDVLPVLSALPALCPGD